MVHITNGDSVADLIRRWSGEPRLIVWRDVLHEGPVPEGLTLEQLSAERARFLDAEPAEFASRDRAMRRLVRRDAIWLWFEDDLYDQLQLLQILDFLHAEGLAGNWVFFIDIPRGLELDQMAALAAAKRPVPPEAFPLAAKAWDAFTKGELESLLDQDLSALPHLRAAVERLQEHYPDTQGLNRVERTILKLLGDGGRTREDLFRAYQATEERPFLGDVVFFDYLDHLAPLAVRDAHGLYHLGAATVRPRRERWVGGRRFLA